METIADTTVGFADGTLDIFEREQSISDENRFTVSEFMLLLDQGTMDKEVLQQMVVKTMRLTSPSQWKQRYPGKQR